MSFPLARRLSPESGQDRGARPHYEGYYARITLPEEGESFAIIGAMARSDVGTEVYAIVLDGQPGERALFTFGGEDFTLSSDTRTARFGSITMSPERLVGSVGETSFALSLDARVRWPGALHSPVGPGLLVPGLESYWHVASLAGTWRGTFTHRGVERRVAGVPGYVEKTWGSRFPSEWTWLQAHAFDRPDVVVAASLAPTKLAGIVPVKAGVLAVRDGGRTLSFATYRGHPIRVEANGGAFAASAEDGLHRVLFDARFPRDAIAALEGPLPGGIAPCALETLVATGELILERKTRLGYDTVWRTKTSFAGLEVGGDGRFARCGL